MLQVTQSWVDGEGGAARDWRLIKLEMDGPWLMTSVVSHHFSINVSHFVDGGFLRPELSARMTTYSILPYPRHLAYVERNRIFPLSHGLASPSSWRISYPFEPPSTSLIICSHHSTRCIIRPYLAHRKMTVSKHRHGHYGL